MTPSFHFGTPAAGSTGRMARSHPVERERELVGMYLSAHPLDPYYMELNYGTS